MLLDRLRNRLRWLTTGIEPTRETRPMTFIEGVRFFRDVAGDEQLTSAEVRDLVQWGMRNDQLNVDLPLNY